MVDLSAYGLGQFNLTPEDIFYVESPNCRGPLRHLKAGNPKPPRQRIWYPDNPPDHVFLAQVPCKQPVSVERIAAYPNNNILSGVAWDFTSRFVGDYRLRRNFHRVISTLVLKESHEASDFVSYTEQAQIDEDIWQFFGDRHLQTSLLLRNHFSLRMINTSHGTSFEEAFFSKLYQGIFDRDYRRWRKTHLRYREGPRRPSFLLVARSRLQSTSVLAECPVQMVAWPNVDINNLYAPYDKALWDSLKGQEKVDACDILLRDEADDEELDEYRRRWMEEGEIVSGPPASMTDAHSPRTRSFTCGPPRQNRSGATRICPIYGKRLERRSRPRVRTS